jgi:hypothetical protein
MLRTVVEELPVIGSKSRGPSRFCGPSLALNRYAILLVKRKPILVLPLRSGLYTREDLVEGNTIKQPAIGDNGVDFLGVPDVS